LEHFLDPHQAVITSFSPERFGAFGASLNVDYEIFPRFIWRTELRRLQDSKGVFPDGSDGFDKSNNLVVTSLSLSLG
jgi:hypothetical protein